jgi:hypothetical protein
MRYKVRVKRLEEKSSLSDKLPTVGFLNDDGTITCTKTDGVFEIDVFEAEYENVLIVEFI